MKRLSAVLVVGVMVFFGTVYLTRATDIDLGVEISEIMYDTPDNADAGGEWIEIHNNTGGELNISGWQIYDGNNWRTISQWSDYKDITAIPNGSFAVIAEPLSTYNFTSLYPGFEGYLAQTNGPLFLDNDGDVLVLQNAVGTSYQDFWYPDNAENESMIKFVIFGNEDDESLWVAASTDWGTPGSMDTGADQSVPVTLSSFTANVSNGQVTLNWTTQTETENLGYHVYRSLTEDGEYERITEALIEGAGSSWRTHTYQFVDRDIKEGKTYFYKLEQIDFDGTKEMHGPIVVTVGKATAAQKNTWGWLKSLLK